MQITQKSLSLWSYVTGAIALVLALVLFILSSTERSGAVGYIVGGVASLLVGAAAITLGFLASHASKGQKAPIPAPSDRPLAPPTRPPSAPSTAPPPSPPSPPSSEGEPPSDALEDESASDVDDDNASQASVTNYTLAPTIPMEEDTKDPAPPPPLRTESPPTTAPRSTLKRQVRVSRADRSSSNPK